VTYTLTYLCNVKAAKFMRGFAAGDPLMEAGTLEVDARVDGAELPACEHAFMYWNRDDRPNGATAPSLSTGDVVRLEYGGSTHHFKCADVGFEPIDAPELFKNLNGLTIIEAMRAFAEPGPKCPDCASDDIVTDEGELWSCGTCGLDARAVAFDPEGQKL
jgi:ribosomal protein S27AE